MTPEQDKDFRKLHCAGFRSFCRYLIEPDINIIAAILLEFPYSFFIFDLWSLYSLEPCGRKHNLVSPKFEFYTEIDNAKSQVLKGEVHVQILADFINHETHPKICLRHFPGSQTLEITDPVNRTGQLPNSGLL